METYKTIEISKITPNPLNPRKIFEGKAFDELVSSIRAKGVLEPIIVRPKNKGFEIVAGERRFRAFSVVAGENGKARKEIPALVRELTDEEAFDIMTIENLHREDLSEMEEAQSFKDYIDKHGEAAVESLAERSGISPRYIRRRAAIFKLPKKILKDWEKGRFGFGVLEQFLRLDKSEVNNLYKEFEHYSHITESDIKSRIDRRAINLGKAIFSTKKAGCHTCSKNTQVQCSIFGDDFQEGKAACCLDPKCFTGKVEAYLKENWNETALAKQCGTNGFRFSRSLDYDSWEGFYTKPWADCKNCPSYVTLIEYDGTKRHDRVCLDPTCYKAKKRAADKSASANAPSEKPAKPGHGQEFRELFYATRLPEAISAAPADSDMVLRLTLAAILHADALTHHWFIENVIRSQNIWMGNDELFAFILTMDAAALKEAIRAASLEVVMHSGYGATARHMVGSHFGIDLSRDWQIHEGYLKKKTIAEILAMGGTLEIFKDEKVIKYLAETLKKTVKQCKKTELIDLILKSGVDLAGKVPEEIKNVPIPPAPKAKEKKEDDRELDD